MNQFKKLPSLLNNLFKVEDRHRKKLLPKQTRLLHALSNKKASAGMKVNLPSSGLGSLAIPEDKSSLDIPVEDSL